MYLLSGNQESVKESFLFDHAQATLAVRLAPPARTESPLQQVAAVTLWVPHLSLTRPTPTQSHQVSLPA